MSTSILMNKFNIQEVLSYFIPGISILLSILLFLEQIQSFNLIELELTIGFLLISSVISMILGIISSGFAHPITSIIYRITKFKNPENEIKLSFLKEGVINQFSSKIIKINLDEWNEECYTICKVFVKEKMPASYEFTFRQESLRLFRMYMFVPILLWMLNGIYFTLTYFKKSPLLGVCLSIGCLCLSFLLIWNLWKRMHANRERGVRNILVAFAIHGK